MRMRTVEIGVGGFMLAGMITLIILAFKVSGLTRVEGDGTYTLTARFENVAGLTTRARVSISGVSVGQVKGIYFDKENYVAVVEMSIDQNVDNLTTDTSASILTAGLLGEKYIGLSIGADEDYLMDGDEIFDTQSAIVLEELIGQFIFNRAAE